MDVKTVREVSRLAGVSVRTLHHYDAIGLLKPTAVTAAGYRLYDDRALSRLQSILLFRELRFPLGQIRAILDSPGFDAKEALRQQIKLLELQRQRIDELIALAKETERKGECNMDFKAFDRSAMDGYADEVRRRWGGTEAYAEYQRRGTADSETSRKLMALIAGFGELKEFSPSAPRVKKKVVQLQSFITDNFYTCTDEILAGLGKMYAADERFRRNIDRAGGEGTAEFTSRAIATHLEG